MAGHEAQPFHWHYDELDDRNFRVGGRTLLFLIISFSILLICTLVFLYVRWACGRHRRWAAETAAAAPLAVGLEPRIIATFPVSLHRASAAGDEQCSICLSGLMEEEKVRVLPRCGHTFHVECVDEWLRAHTSCPLCRASLDGSSAEMEKVAMA